MLSQGDLRRLRIGRRRGCRGDGWVWWGLVGSRTREQSWAGGARWGRGEGCPAVSARPRPVWPCPGIPGSAAGGGGPRASRAPHAPRRPRAPGAPPSASVSAPRICGCQLPRAASLAGGAMGCGNSTATSAGASQGERGGQVAGAPGQRRWGGGEPCRAGRSCGRGQERGGWKERCRDPGQGEYPAPSLRPSFRDRSRPPGFAKT